MVPAPPMAANARTGPSVDVDAPCTLDPARERLERAARSLLMSDLKFAILAMIAERKPTP
jgi:hypothetical protein